MAVEMISVSEAKRLVLQHAITLEPKKLSLADAAGLVLAEDIYPSIAIPAYDQSSMDGYAFAFDDLDGRASLEIRGEMAAGSDKAFTLSPGQAARIFTGAAIPAGADTVVMQEKTRIEKGQLIIEDPNLQQGLNVRRRGSEIKPGELAMANGCLLQPAAIGFLAGIGITHILAYAPPTLGLVVTGNELQEPGKPLSQGQVYESNSFSLRAALKQLNICKVDLHRAEDKLETVENVLKHALRESDVVLLTGGVSVGDYDFVAAAALANGVEKVFHKIKQRPGKPLFFGTKEGKLVFGLPGNPASVLTCFYEYVEPAIRKIMHQQPGIRIGHAPLSEPVRKAAGLTHFLKGLYDGETVTPLHAQESYRLSSFAGANCLVKIEEDITACEKGDLVEIHLLPQ